MNQSDAERNRRGREFIQALKRVPCHDCHGTFETWQMNHDHVPERGPKLHNVASMTAYTLEAIQREADKCDVVCCNCHATRTHNRGQLTKRLK